MAGVILLLGSPALRRKPTAPLNPTGYNKGPAGQNILFDYGYPLVFDRESIGNIRKIIMPTAVDWREVSPLGTPPPHLLTIDLLPGMGDILTKGQDGGIKDRASVI